ncbi:hypothetical protein [Nitrobacter hamburgensis]|uniref:hypothetical protein n=1 Tax=Nitrobacter hamburgensis TaxID=912 RepID=UPI0002F92E23|nr:hypothetical protein [Nitrobacter hamburgensis]
MESTCRDAATKDNARLSFEETGTGMPVLFVHDFAARLPTAMQAGSGARLLAQTPQHH